jgi:hypothetical protein
MRIREHLHVWMQRIKYRNAFGLYNIEDYEISHFLIGDRSIAPIYTELSREKYEGNRFYVTFDDEWKKAWNLAVNNRLIGFYHTHPFCKHKDALMPSSMDEKTMRGWVVATGLDLVCIIGNGNGDTKAWVFKGEDVDTDKGKLTQVTYSPIDDVIPLTVGKSYGLKKNLEAFEIKYRMEQSNG